MTYTMTSWDYAAMTRAVTQRTWRRRVVTLVLWLVGVWGLLVWLTGVFSPVELAAVIIKSGSVQWLLVTMAIVLLSTMFSHWMGWAVSFVYYKQLASADATITMSLSDTAIMGESSIADTKVRWSTVKRIICETDYLFLPISPREAFILPKRSFASEAEFAAACTYATERFSMSRGG